MPIHASKTLMFKNLISSLVLHAILNGFQLVLQQYKSRVNGTFIIIFSYSKCHKHFNNFLYYAKFC